MRTNHTAKNRIGVVAGVAVSKSAAKRNFLKRQVKTTLVDAAPVGRDILVILSSGAKTLTKRKLKETLLDAMAQFSNSPQ